jgi:ribonuclease BN (tRNA processing enzyme)
VGLSVTVLGCAGSYPGPGGACSSYLVRSSTTTLWLDAGSGSLANLQRHVGILDVDAVVLSHEHPDHTGDLAGFYVACKYYLHRDRVPVYAPASVADTLYYSGPPIDWRKVADGSEAEVGDLRLTFSRTDHGPETLAVRVDGDGRSLGYSADSGPAWSLAKLGPGLDLALCEATYLSDSEGRAQHMSARQAGQSAREAGVGRLVLTHQQPGVDPEAVRAEGAAAFGRDVDVAVVGAEFEA